MIFLPTVAHRQTRTFFLPLYFHAEFITFNLKMSVRGCHHF